MATDAHHRAPNEGGGFGVLALASIYPHARRPRQGSFNRQQYQALAGLCRLGLVAPIPFRQLRGGVKAAPASADPGFPVRRPIFWYPPGVLKGLHGRFYLASAWPALRRMAGELKPRVLLANFIYPDAWAGMLAARRLGLPLVAQALGSDLLLAGKDPARREQVAQVLRSADGVMVKSPGLFRAAIELGAAPERVRLVPNGVDQKLFKPADRDQARQELGLPAKGGLVLFVGNLLPVKNPVAALEAIAATSDAHLVMVGDGPLAARLKSRAGELGLAGRVHWTGTVSHEQVAVYMAACDALILPSLSEGDPNAVLEALASGRPVVASDVGGVSELVRQGEQGALAPPGDSQALGRALDMVLDSTWDPAKLRASVSERSWEKSAASLLDLLQDVAAGRGGPGSA